MHYLLQICDGEIKRLLVLESLERTLKIVAAETLYYKLFIIFTLWLSLLLTALSKQYIHNLAYLILLLFIAHYCFHLSNKSLFLLHGNVQSPQLFIDMLAARLLVRVDHWLPAVVGLGRDQDVVLLDETQLVLHLLQLLLQGIVLKGQKLKIGFYLFYFFWLVLHFVAVPGHFVDWIFQFSLKSVSFIGYLVQFIESLSEISLSDSKLFSQISDPLLISV